MGLSSCDSGFINKTICEQEIQLYGTITGNIFVGIKDRAKYIKCDS